MSQPCRLYQPHLAGYQAPPRNPTHPAWRSNTRNGERRQRRSTRETAGEATESCSLLVLDEAQQAAKSHGRGPSSVLCSGRAVVGGAPAFDGVDRGLELVALLTQASVTVVTLLRTTAVFVAELEQKMSGAPIAIPERFGQRELVLLAALGEAQVERDGQRGRGLGSHIR